MSSIAFNTDSNIEKIYVPYDSIEVYKSANNWSDFADIIEGYDFE